MSIPEYSGQSKKKAKDIENKIQDAPEDLSAVNRALEAEIKARHALENQLNATQEQADAARHAAFHDPLISLPGFMPDFSRK